MKLHGCRALVTGGAVRIGRGLCRALAGRSCSVAIHYDRSRDEAMALARELEREGVHAAAVHGHLEDETGCRALLDNTVEAIGPVNILVNNASIFSRHTLHETSWDGLMNDMRINYMIPFVLTRLFAERLTARRKAPKRISGKVVNLLDRRVKGTDPACVSYQISKKALACFTEAAAVALAPGITVNAIAPGAILPPSQKGNPVKDYAGDNLLPHKSTVEDIANAMIYLLEADALTGQTIFVDSGRRFFA